MSFGKTILGSPVAAWSAIAAAGASAWSAATTTAATTTTFSAATTTTFSAATTTAAAFTATFAAISAAFFAAFAATIGGGADGLFIVLAELLHRRFARKLDASLIVDEQYLDLHLIADVHEVGD